METLSSDAQIHQYSLNRNRENIQMKSIILKSVALFIVIMSLALYACAQKLSTKNKKAIKAYYSGVQYFDYRKYASAEEQFQFAIQLDPAFVEARQMLGTMYEEQKKFSQAIEQYLKVQEINPAFFPNNYFLLGNLLLKDGRYDDALINFRHFLVLPDIRSEIMTEAEAQMKNTEFAISLKNNPVPFIPVNLGPAINTPDDEFFPTLTADEEILYFTKVRPRDQFTICAHCKFEEDFYVSRKIDGKWETARPLGYPINTHGNEGAGTISPDGMIFIFTACERSDGLGSCDLYISRKEGRTWSFPENMGAVVNSSKWDTQPSIAPDGKTLYFVSSRDGNVDIFVTIADENGVWQTPVNLGKPVNTDKVENTPFIHPDGKTLYFMSNGHPGMGGMDIYMTRKQNDGTWQNPVNIGYPINTHRDEGFFIVSASGTTAYYASDQLDGYGKFDIYCFDLPEQARPEPVYYLKGIITDANSHKPIRADFELYDLSTGQLVVKSESDQSDGSFLLCLPTHASYGLNVNKSGYLFYSENFSIIEEGTESGPVIKNIELLPIQEGNIVILRNVFFDFDSDQLKPESISELQKLMKLLMDNPLMNIEIGGHTDNVGSSSYNKILSEKRAVSVYNYLVLNGIRKERLTYKGYGDTQPIVTNETEEGRASNRRTEFKVMKNQ
jgi:outer membrane protein OmpA-like peptidoglycan-associated protein/tetratricopeptide (TPR) repeat protein